MVWGPPDNAEEALGSPSQKTGPGVAADLSQRSPPLVAAGLQPGSKSSRHELGSESFCVCQGLRSAPSRLGPFQ